MARPAGSDREDRPGPAHGGRARRARPFASTFSPLEGRTMLSTTAPIPIGPAPAARAGVAPSPPGQGGGAAPGASPRGGGNRAVLAVAEIRVDGNLTPEFALADPARNEVFTRLGSSGRGHGPAGAGPRTVWATSSGISDPTAVNLTDVNGDAVPDLIVANAGGGNILAFPGIAGGGFGPEVNGGRGFAVGKDPAGITVGDINGDGHPDLIVADQGSNDVSILLGRGDGGNWTLSSGPTIPAGLAPVRTALADPDNNGIADLFICNSGSDTVTMYRGRGDGTFDTAAPTIFPVGNDPSEMFVGRFDRHPQADLVTVNSGSDDLTFVAGVFTDHPSTQTYSSGGTRPESAFAVDLNRDGVMDLVVANGDGRLALLRGGNDGLQLAGLISRPDAPGPAALAPAGPTGAGLDFFVAGAGQDAAEILHFDLGPASAFLAAPWIAAGDESASESELIAQLVPYGDSALEMIAVLWEAGPGPGPAARTWNPAVPPSITAMYRPTEGQGVDGAKSPADVAGRPATPAARPDPPPGGPDAWTRFVLGLDEALGRARGPVGAIAARDAEEAVGDRPPADLARADLPAVDPDVAAVDEALRSLWSDVPAGTAAPAPHAEPTPAPLDLAPSADGKPVEAVPVVASTLLASRWILKASPPRPRPASGWRPRRLSPGPGGGVPARL